MELINSEYLQYFHTFYHKPLFSPQGNTVEKDSGLCYYVVYTSVLYPQAEEGADEPFAVIHGEVFRVADVGEVIHHRKA